MEKWEQYLRKKLNGNPDFDENEKEDVLQKLRIEILKVYCNQWKYTSFSNVVKSTIKRRMVDYLKISRREKKRFINESSLVDNSDEEGKKLSYIDLIEQPKIEVKEIYIYDTIKKFFEERVKDGDLKLEFTKYEKEIFEIIIFLHEQKTDFNDSDIFECMGYDSNNQREKRKFYSKYSRFRTKMNRFLNEIGIIR